MREGPRVRKYVLILEYINNTSKQRSLRYTRAIQLKMSTLHNNFILETTVVHSNVYQQGPELQEKTVHSGMTVFGKLMLHLSDVTHYCNTAGQ